MLTLESTCEFELYNLLAFHAIYMHRHGFYEILSHHVEALLLEANTESIILVFRGFLSR